MLSYLMLSIAFLTTMMKHPISLGSTLIIQTILMCVMITKMSSTSWYSYILFITMIGGLMVMFMYMASIASNEKFKMNMMLLFMMMISMMIMLTKENIMENILNMNEMKIYMTEKEEMKSTSKFFNFNKMNITIMIMMMLLMSMVVITSISSNFEGPLKKTYV